MTALPLIVIKTAQISAGLDKQTNGRDQRDLTETHTDMKTGFMIEMMQIIEERIEMVLEHRLYIYAIY